MEYQSGEEILIHFHENGKAEGSEFPSLISKQ